MMKEGDVILTPVPQADGTIKTRPAIILREMPPYKDFLVCGVSTQLHQQVKDFDESFHLPTGFHLKRFEISIIGTARISGCTAQ